MPTLAKVMLLCAAAALSGAPARAAETKIMIEAQMVLRACFDNMPDSRKVRAAFRAAGLRPEGLFGDYHAFSGQRWKLMGIIAATLTTDKTPECGVLVDKMSLAEAQILVTPFLNEIRAGQATTKDPGIAVVYAGLWRGNILAVAITREEDAYHLKGSAVIFQDMGPAKQ